MIGRDVSGNDVSMPTFILSNRGRQDAAGPNDDEVVSCSPRLLEKIQIALINQLKSRGLPHNVRLYTVFRGGYICRRYTTISNPDTLAAGGITVPVESLQVECNIALTHDQRSLAPDQEKMIRLRAAFTAAIEIALQPS